MIHHAFIYPNSASSLIWKVSLGFACYFGRVLLAQLQLLPAAAHPVDFVNSTGLVANVAIGGGVLALWSLAQTGATRFQEDLERWRWRTAGPA